MNQKKMKRHMLFITSALVILSLVALCVRVKFASGQVQKPSFETLSDKINELKGDIDTWKKSAEKNSQDILNLSMTNPPVGTIMAFAGEFPPYRNRNAGIKWTEDELGWALCDGTYRSITTHPKLYEAIGYLWGGKKGDQKFRLPDLQGLFLRGLDPGGINIDPDRDKRLDSTRKNIVGAVIGSYQTSTFATHLHPIDDPGHVHSSNAQGSVREEVQGGSGASANGWDNFDGNAFVATINSNKTGITSTREAGNSAETRPYNAYVYYIIKFK